uniref:2-C-methyl-D-erythritol 4-phosphate cytidylyltransferase n=1 Tax=Phenylobacterium sp. TaxID=1871053 RepID=UPI0035C80DC4
MDFSAVLVAAGSGSRAGGGLPKAWRPLAGRPLARWSAEALAQAGAREIAVVVAADMMETARAALTGLPGGRFVLGGATRALSVQAGLSALTATPDELVLVHDAARPFLNGSHVARLLEACAEADGA